MPRMKDKVVLISGGARGMGVAHTRAFVREGARVVSFDVNDGEGPALVRELGEDRLLFSRGDVTAAGDWARVVAAGEEKFGRIDVLVNNAGISPIQRLESVSEQDYRRVIDINQVGTFLGMQAVIPGMRRSGGAIVNICSTAGLVGFTDIFPYVASKWAVRGMTKAAALELAEFGIRVNSIHPGDIETDMIAGAADTGAVPAISEIPLGRYGRPREISDLVAFLISDFSSYITGAELTADGGYTAR